MTFEEGLEVFLGLVWVERRMGLLDRVKGRKDV